MFYNINPDCEDEKQNQSLSADPQFSFTPTARSHEIWCSVEGCECGRHPSMVFEKQAPVPAFRKRYYQRYCSTIQEVTEPTVTFSSGQLTNKFSSFIRQNCKGRNYLDFMSRSGDCVAFHTRGKSKLA